MADDVAPKRGFMCWALVPPLTIFIIVMPVALLSHQTVTAIAILARLEFTD